MERDSQTLTKLAEDYHLQIGDVKFWTPYWINKNTEPYFLNAPYDGKGTPGQIMSVLERRLKHRNQKPKTAADYQKLMLGWGLGIDCSGLAYYVLSHWLRSAYQIRLTDHLYISKADVVQASQKPSWQQAGVSKSKIDSLPDPISLSTVCQLFKRHPMHITNVARLTSPQAVMTISAVGDARPGDIIKTTGSSGDHMGVVVELNPGRIRYAESRGHQSGMSQVRYQDIKVMDPTKGLEFQEWDDNKIFDPKVGDRLCRLKVVDERS